MKYFAKYIAGALSLCSRDIQVGDIVDTINLLTPEWSGKGEVFSLETKPALYGIDLGHTTTYLTREEIFKVIGEISPEATWVKEGDEFDEESVDFKLVFIEDGVTQSYMTANEINQWVKLNPNPKTLKVVAEIKD